MLLNGDLRLAACCRMACLTLSGVVLPLRTPLCPARLCEGLRGTAAGSVTAAEKSCCYLQLVDCRLDASQSVGRPSGVEVLGGVERVLISNCSIRCRQSGWMGLSCRPTSGSRGSTGPHAWPCSRLRRGAPRRSMRRTPMPPSPSSRRDVSRGSIEFYGSARVSR